MGRVAKNRSGSLLRGGARRGPEGGCPKAPAEGGGRGWGVRLDSISDSNSDSISDWISDCCGTVSSTWVAQGRRAARGGVPELELWNEGKEGREVSGAAREDVPELELWSEGQCPRTQHGFCAHF